MQTKTRTPSLPKSVEKYIGIEWGQWAPGATISIDTPLAKCQRDYKKQNVYKYIAKIGGLDRNLFGYAKAVRRKSDGAIVLIDGQHRINLVKIVSPATKFVPAQIIDVEDVDFEAYSAKLFHETNGTASKSLSNEEIFYSQVIAGDDYALQIEKVLKSAGLSCGRVNALLGTYPVEYATFVKCFKKSIPATVRAAKLLSVGFNSVNTNVLHGLVFLFTTNNEYAELADTKKAMGKHFETWLTKAVPMFHGINDLKFKRYQQGPWERGVAFGIAQSFAKFQRNKGLTAPSISEIKKIYKEGFDKEDSGIL